MSVCEVLLTNAPLVASPLADFTEAGAILDFWGVVRLREGEHDIAGLDYEAHGAMAEYQLRRLAEEAAERFQLMQVRIFHRTGFVAVGEASLLVRVASRHRAAAFAAGEWLVDELKKRVPIWKNAQGESIASANTIQAPLKSPSSAVVA